MDSAYAKARTGALKLGGVEVKRSEKHKKKHKKQKREREESGDEGRAEEREVTAVIEVPIVILSGSGRISTSSTTVQGHEGTKFVAELKAGDAIIVNHPVTMRDEASAAYPYLPCPTISYAAAMPRQGQPIPVVGLAHSSVWH
jgi:hypothetical protein